MDHHIHDRLGSGRDTGSVYQELHHDLQHLLGVRELSFPVAAAGFYVFQFL